MLDQQTRKKIINEIGRAINSVVREHYRGLTQEPAITSRIGQNMEARLDELRVGEYVFRVITQDFPDRGPGSLERLTGADLFVSVSLEGTDGFDKGLLVQTKFDHSLKRSDLQAQCTRMRQISDSSYVWVYTARGVSVVSADEVIERMAGNSIEGLQKRSVAGFFGRVLDCHAGNRDLGIPATSGRRTVLTRRLEGLRAQVGVDIELEHVSTRKRRGP